MNVCRAVHSITFRAKRQKLCQHKKKANDGLSYRLHCSTFVLQSCTKRNAHFLKVPPLPGCLRPSAWLPFSQRLSENPVHALYWSSVLTLYFAFCTCQTLNDGVEISVQEQGAYAAKVYLIKCRVWSLRITYCVQVETASAGRRFSSFVMSPNSPISKTVCFQSSFLFSGL